MRLKHFADVKTLKGKPECRWVFSNNDDRKSNDLYSFDGPNAKIYTLESITNCKFIFPFFLLFFAGYLLHHP